MREYLIGEKENKVNKPDMTLRSEVCGFEELGGGSGLRRLGTKLLHNESTYILCMWQSYLQTYIHLITCMFVHSEVHCRLEGIGITQECGNFPFKG